MLQLFNKKSNLLSSSLSLSYRTITCNIFNKNNNKILSTSMLYFQNVKNNIQCKKYYNTTTLLLNNLSQQQIPSNLKLADESILLNKDDNKLIIPEQAYYFPQLDIPNSIKVAVFNKPGEYTNDINLNKKIFGVALRKDIVHEVIRYQRHKVRQPKKTKRIGDISGSNKKPWAQKKVGKAQFGNKRNSVWRKGQKAHGPVIRDYSINCNKKFRALGMMIALAVKYREGNLTIFDKIECETIKTKDLVNLLKGHGLNDSKLLLVADDLQDNLITASQNLALVDTITQEGANVYTIMKKDKLAISSKAFDQLQNRIWSQYTHGGKRTAFLNALEFVRSASSMSTLSSSSN